MATYQWIGGAASVAQVDTITISTYHASTTYSIKIGGVIVATALAAGSANATATALAAAFTASTHPWKSDITAGAATNVVTLTATTAGLPFYAASSVSGGTGTTTDAITTYPTSAYHFNNPANWQNVDTGLASTTLPTASDTIIIAGGPNIVWDGPYGSSPDYIGAELLASATQMDTYTGRIGTDQRYFVTSADGTTVNQTIGDYSEGNRIIAPRIYATTLTLGRITGARNASGSQRVNIQHRCATIVVESTAASPIDQGLTAVRIMSMISSGTSRAYYPDSLGVSSAPGGVTYGSALSATSAANTPCPTAVYAQGSTSRLVMRGNTNVSNNYGTIFIDGGASVSILDSNGSVSGNGWDIQILPGGGTLSVNGAGEIKSIDMMAGSAILMNTGAASFDLTMHGSSAVTVPLQDNSGGDVSIDVLESDSPSTVFVNGGLTANITTNNFRGIMRSQ